MGKVLFTTIMLSILLVFSGCYQHQRSEIREFTAEYREHMELIITNHVGRVVIEEWDREEVIIKAEIIGRSDSESLAETIVQETIIHVVSVEEGLKIGSERIDRSDASLRIDYTIKIPPLFNCSVHSSVGDIHLVRAEGDVYAETGTGNVTVDYLKGQLKISGGTGDIRLGNLEGDIDVRTSTGDIRIDYVRGELHNLETSTGSISSTLEILKGTENRIQSSTGDITLYLRGNISAHLWANVGTGEISLEGLNLLLEQREDKRVVGILGAGESYLSLQTSTGDIRIVRD